MIDTGKEPWISSYFSSNCPNTIHAKTSMKSVNHITHQNKNNLAE